jgi:putative hydrolase of the HAD superfamily
MDLRSGVPALPPPDVPRAVVFDMDNTLFDFIRAKRHACREIVTFLDSGNPNEIFDYFITKGHGFESHENIREYLVDRGEYTPRVFRECCRIYEEEKLAVIEPYPGVREGLECACSLGLALAVLTDASREQARARLGKTGLLGYFGEIISYDMTGEKKPGMAPFLAALDRLGTRPHETILVGDSIRRDIAPAGELGFITMHAVYGGVRLHRLLPGLPHYRERRSRKGHHGRCHVGSEGRAEPGILITERWQISCKVGRNRAGNEGQEEDEWLEEEDDPGEDPEYRDREHDRALRVDAVQLDPRKEKYDGWYHCLEDLPYAGESGIRDLPGERAEYREDDGVGGEVIAGHHQETGEKAGEEETEKGPPGFFHGYLRIWYNRPGPA